MSAANGFPVLSSQPYLDGKAVRETRALVADLCRQFYTLGWVSGTGGSITIKVHDDSIPKPDQLIVMSPSGVQKERIIPEDMYVLSSCGEVLSTPSPKPYPNKLPKCSDCAPLFMKAYHTHNAGAVIHSHGMESCLVTMINPLSKEFRIYIYSSGSREAQRLIFGNTAYGDLREYLCGYFDTTVGNKREARSYFEIFQSVGVDIPSQILFITDVHQEAVAAKAAGLEVIISIRPGNAPLPEDHGFRTIASFAEI